jgi:transposase
MSMTVEGGTDTAVFTTYLEHFLLPGAGAGNGGRGGQRRRAPTGADPRAGRRRWLPVVFLSAYSPDLSPIEEAFSKIKALVKAAAARTPGGPGRRDRRRTARRHRGRRGRLVLSRRLPHPTSCLKTAVSSALMQRSETVSSLAAHARVHVPIDGERDGGARVTQRSETTFTGTPSASSRVA